MAVQTAGSLDGLTVGWSVTLLAGSKAGKMEDSMAEKKVAERVG